MSRRRFPIRHPMLVQSKEAHIGGIIEDHQLAFVDHRETGVLNHTKRYLNLGQIAVMTYSTMVRYDTKTS